MISRSKHTVLNFLPPSVNEAEGMKRVDSRGVYVTIIDYTFARLHYAQSVLARPFDDDDYFTGTGDTQFDVYREMRDHLISRRPSSSLDDSMISLDWNGHHPRTTLLWIHYLVVKIIETKEISCDGALDVLKAFSDRVLAYENVSQLMEDNFFADCG